MRQLALYVRWEQSDIAELFFVGTAFWNVIGAVGLLKEVDQVVNACVKDLQVTAEVKA
jgi:hypothetical protein